MSAFNACNIAEPDTGNISLTQINVTKNRKTQEARQSRDHKKAIGTRLLNISNMTL